MDCVRLRSTADIAKLHMYWIAYHCPRNDFQFDQLLSMTLLLFLPCPGPVPEFSDLKRFRGHRLCG